MWGSEGPKLTLLLTVAENARGNARRQKVRVGPLISSNPPLLLVSPFSFSL